MKKVYLVPSGEVVFLTHCWGVQLTLLLESKKCKHCEEGVLGS